MLTLFSEKNSRSRDHWRRRDFISAGSLMLGSLTLPQLLHARREQVSDQTDASDFARDRSVVLLYLSGGASQIETFDPKDSAPDGIRSTTGSVTTSLAGVRLGGTFPRLAKLMNQLSIVRSFQHGVGSHDQAHVHMLTGGTDPRGDRRSGYSVGSMVSRLRGANHPETGMPTYSLLTESEVDTQYRRELSRVRKGSHAGALGSQYAPFEPGGGGPLLDNMRLNVEPDRFGDRRQLLKQLGQIRSQLENRSRQFHQREIERLNEQAVNVLFGGVTRAFDLSEEDDRLLERYDTSQIPIGFKKFRPSTLGHQMLVARRLCEHGCGFVTVHSAGWDMHADSNNPGMVQGMDMLGRSLDQAVSTFLEDLADRRLSQKILLVIMGDFGRTPKVNKKGGRDHWARLCPLLFAGGGLNMGQVVGKSTRDAGEPDSDPYTTSHLMATIMHSMFDLGQLRLQAQFPRSILQVAEKGEPIRELV